MLRSEQGNADDVAQEKGSAHMSWVQPLETPDVKIQPPEETGITAGSLPRPTATGRCWTRRSTSNCVQDNQAFSAQKRILRGLQFQTLPYAQPHAGANAAGGICAVLVGLREVKSRATQTLRL